MDMKKIVERKKRVFIIILAVIICVGIILSVFLFNLFRIIEDEKTYTVNFYSENNEIIKTETVKSGKAALPPEELDVSDGKIFKKWDTDFSSVRNDLEIKPVFNTIDGKENVFALSGAYGQKNGTITTSLVLRGDVELSGFDLTVEYDKDVLEYISVINKDGSVICNDSEPGKIKVNFVSVENTLGDVDICSFKFKAGENKKEAPLAITVNKVYAYKDNTLYEPKYNIINSTIYVY